jgi:hypothetical protein
MLLVRNAVEALAVLAEAKRRFIPQKVAYVAKRVWRFLSELHAKQRLFHDSPSRRKAALCSRRAGKSWVAAAMLLEAAGDHPDSLCVYIALTRGQARRIMWKELKRFNRAYNLGLAFNETALVATLKNGSEIMLLGAVNEADIDKLRGVAFVLAVIDEAASFPVRKASSSRGQNIQGDSSDKAHRDLLHRLYRDVLQPTMLDYQGSVVLLGTPAAHCSGFFFEVTRPDKDRRRKGWDVHEWTFRDNPFVPKIKTKEIPDAASWFQKEIVEAEGVDINDPAIQREWFARWIRSTEALVYPSFNERRNVYRDIKNDKRIEWFYGVSVDLGYDDPTVIGLFKWSNDVPDVYLTKVIKGENWIPSRIAKEILRLEKEVGALAFTVVDQGGGAGKMIAEEFKSRWHLPNVRAAQKTAKPTFIKMMNGDLATGRFHIHESCVPVLDEIGVLQWDPRFLGVKEDERFANDACDMALYGWRETRGGVGFDEDRTPDQLMPEDKEREEDEMEEQLERDFKRSQNEDDLFG